MSQGPTEAGVHQVQSWTSSHTNTNSDSFSVLMELVWLPLGGRGLSRGRSLLQNRPSAAKMMEICKCGCKCWTSHSCVSLSVQIENIDVCLTFLAAKGVNTQGLSAEGKPPPG